jgi:hypothetical protein
MIQAQAGSGASPTRLRSAPIVMLCFPGGAVLSWSEETVAVADTGPVTDHSTVIVNERCEPAFRLLAVQRTTPADRLHPVDADCSVAP